jgi:signal transduction histidine kinase
MRHGRDQAQAEQLRALGERLEQAREAERSRIARELHDELGQILTGIKIDFDRSVRQFKHWNAPPDVVERIQSAMMNIDLAIATVQRLAGELRPAALDHRDLGGAIEYEATIVSARSGVPIRVVNHIGIDVPPETGTVVFRIFQEALLNAIRHAGAAQIRVRAASRASHLFLFIRDDGVGCPEALAPDGSLGIRGMQERARYLGATFRIRGRRGRGTRVVLHLSLDLQ